MTQQLEKYIDEHRVCPDLLFRDWKSFLNVLFENGKRVNAILWFEYVLIHNQAKSIGGGGYRDPQNPNYMWAETMLHDKNLDEKSLFEIINHIEETIKSYPSHNLVPSFFI